MHLPSPVLRSATKILPALILLLWLGTAGGQQTINNSALIPKVAPDSEVRMEGMSPDWVKTLIMAEFRIETATPEGTFAAAATRVLDHYAEMGVNGLWIDPIYERGSKGNGYGNYGPLTIEPLLTGAKTTEDSFRAVKQFVDEAHRRNIRVFFDIIVWGTRKEAPLVTEHPEFYRKIDGKLWEVWGGYGFDWSNAGLRKWYKEATVRFVERTGADGFRVDLAPDTSGYFFKEIRDALYAEGRKIAIISEIPNKREYTFDLEQVGVTGWTEETDWAHPEHLKEQKAKFPMHNEYLFKANIVDAIRTGAGIGKATLQQEGEGGMFRFYTSNLLDHDDARPFVTGNRVRFGYSSILAPFIPMWWIGEEWNNPNVQTGRERGCVYFTTIDWSEMDVPANRAFYEDAKRYIRIRRSLPGIFEQFPASTREANIAKVESRKDGAANNLQAYARFGGGKAVLVVPNYGGEARGQFEVTPDLGSMGLNAGSSHRIVDLMTGEALPVTVGGGKRSFTVAIEGECLGVFLVERQ
jgi:hypothetical protein